MADFDHDMAENEQHDAYDPKNQEEEEDDEEEEDILDVGGEDDQHDSSNPLLMRFCPHDSSMLYPQEDKRTHTLRYACRLCRYTEESSQPLIYRNMLQREVGNVLATVPASVSDDPTLARSQNANCANCGHYEAVFFQPNDARFDTLALIFVCCNCDYKWVN
jgi:DNA-directed RNA polymerase II subunit RPB9